MNHADEQIQSLMKQGRKIEAIKVTREAYGLGLAEAKAYVEAIDAGESPAAWAQPGMPDPVPLAERVKAGEGFDPEIDDLLRVRKKLEAVKLYRERTRLGLKESKDAIELRMVELGLQTRPSKCFIATAAFGGADEPEVKALRGFRGRVLRKSAGGRAFIRVYETLSPPIASVVERSEALAAVVRVGVRVMARWVERIGRK